MALSSPGVQVTVIDESFYTPAAPGTVPLIIVASAEDKQNASGTGTAVGTMKENAGRVYLITSQRDLTDTFGTPLFYTDAGGNPINGGELNEYGLQAAYSLLGVSSRAYITRADVDLGSLLPTSSVPVGEAADGTFWLDTTSNTSWGIFEWNATTGQFVNKIPAVIDNTNKAALLDGDMPAQAFGVAGTYAIVATSANMITLWYKNKDGNWVEVGSNTETGFTSGSTFNATAWQTSFPVVKGTKSVTAGSLPNGATMLINGQEITLSGTDVIAMASSINATMRTKGVNARVGTSNVLELYADQTASSNGASGATAVAVMTVAAATVVNTGTNYAVGNVLTVLGGNGTAASLTVSGVNANGSITGFSFADRGEYTGTIPSVSNALTTVNTGTGTNAALSLTFKVEMINVTAPGFEYSGDTPPTVSIGGNAHLGAVTIVSGGITGIAVTDEGSGYTSIPTVSISTTDTDAHDGRIEIKVGSTATLLTTLGLTAGTYGAVSLFQGPHTQYPDFSTNPSGSVYVKTTSPNKGADWTVKSYNATTKSWVTSKAPIYASPEAAIYGIDPVGDGKAIPAGQIYVEQNYNHGTGAPSSPALVSFKMYRRSATGFTTVTTPSRTSALTFTSTSSFDIKVSSQGVFGAVVNIEVQPGDTLETVAQLLLNNTGAESALYGLSASYNPETFQLAISHTGGGEIRLTDNLRTPLADMGFVAWARSESGVETGTKNLYYKGDYDADEFDFHASNWKPLVFEAKQTAPFTDPVDGQLWYSSVVDQVDIMYHDGSKWVGYKNAFPQSDINGPIVASVAPKLNGGHSDGTDLVNGDIWISTASLEEYGQNIYVWNGTTLKWIKQDPSDQTSPNAWVFANARWANTGYATDASTIKTLLSSNYVDPDAPDPALYPKGTRLWNLRRSGFNVKKFVKNYINVDANDGKNIRYLNEHMDGSGGSTLYNADRWVSVTPNNEDGSGKFGRHAQRGFVVAGLKALIDTSSAIRDTDTLVFNLMATPGYPEAIQNEIALNADRGQTAFVVGDTPFRLAPTGTALSEWGFNVNGAFDNGDVGGTSYDEYMAMFYPSGYTTDNTGNYIVVPPSHMMLRTIATSDQKSYQWFAPAGTRRGGVDNASSVGYLDANNEFHTTALPESLRSVLASVKINPIATLTGVGVVNMGQYTRAKNASSLDRINVARLVAFLRRQMGILAKPYLFEPNDKITRNEIKRAAESLLLELVGQRALYDFIVVCDESNNTPSRIDRSELWLDVAIEPVKAVEFIYIPLRLKNTGEIKAGV
jgi:hypothetical protein